MGNLRSQDIPSSYLNQCINVFLSGTENCCWSCAFTFGWALLSDNNFFVENYVSIHSRP